MHELTLLYGVVDKVGKVVEENGLDHVDAIVIEVGEATSVIPEFLQDGYEVISDDYDFLRGSELIIERVKAIGLCRNCGTEFQTPPSVSLRQSPPSVRPQPTGN